MNRLLLISAAAAALSGTSAYAVTRTANFDSGVPANWTASVNPMVLQYGSVANGFNTQDINTGNATTGQVPGGSGNVGYLRGLDTGGADIYTYQDGSPPTFGTNRINLGDSTLDSSATLRYYYENGSLAGIGTNDNLQDAPYFADTNLGGSFNVNTDSLLASGKFRFESLGGTADSDNQMPMIGFFSQNAHDRYGTLLDDAVNQESEMVYGTFMGVGYNHQFNQGMIWANGGGYQPGKVVIAGKTTNVLNASVPGSSANTGPIGTGGEDAATGQPRMGFSNRLLTKLADGTNIPAPGSNLTTGTSSLTATEITHVLQSATPTVASGLRLAGDATDMPASPSGNRWLEGSFTLKYTPNVWVLPADTDGNGSVDGTIAFGALEAWIENGNSGGNAVFYARVAIEQRLFVQNIDSFGIYYPSLNSPNPNKGYQIWVDDLSYSAITEVPEPGSLALMGFVGAGLLLRRRK